MASQTLADQTFEKWTPGTDTAVLTLGTQEPNSEVTNCLIHANGAEWGLKMPGNVGSTIRQTHLMGGKERALDIVQGSGIRFEDCVFENGPDRAPTESKRSLAKTCDVGIKGGASDIRFTRCTLTDILIGDHSIYDNPHIGAKTRGIVLDHCVHPAGPGTPIILRVLNGEMPQLVNTNAVALVYWRSIVLTYFWVAGKWIDSRVPPK